MIIPIPDHPRTLERHLRDPHGNLVILQDKICLLRITDPIGLFLFTLTSQEPAYRMWARSHGIYFIFLNGALEYIGQSAANKDSEHGLAGRVSVHACGALIRRYLDQYTVSFLPMESDRAEIFDLENCLIEVLDPPANIVGRKRK
jgi:hypothetical protein